MRRLVFLALAVIASLTPGRSVSGPVPFSSSNVSLLFHVPDPGGVGGRFIGKTYYMTTVGGVRIYDVSTPDRPTPLGLLPLPHFENEDVSVSRSRKLLLVSVDRQVSQAGGALIVVDVKNPRAPVIKATLQYPATYTNAKGTKVGGPGHIANCIADCKRYAWITGARDGSIAIVDLKNPAKPRMLSKRIFTPAGKGNAVFKTGIVHDVNTDRYGYVWATGSGGTAMLDVANPLKPVVRYSTRAADNKRYDQFIHHNSLRLSKKVVLVTEEDWEQPQCGGIAGQQGGFQTWGIPSARKGSLRPLDQWTTELGHFVDGGTPAAISCSSHWFAVNGNKVVSVGWYNQGVRFLDVSRPSRIRQVGYWLAPGEIGLGVSQALYVPGHADLVYAVSYNRGLDVLRIAHGGRNAKTVSAPIIPAPVVPAFSPHPDFGYACRIPR